MDFFAKLGSLKVWSTKNGPKASVSSGKKKASISSSKKKKGK